MDLLSMSVALVMGTEYATSMRNTHGMTLDELARVAVCPLKAKHMEHWTWNKIVDSGFIVW